MFALNRIIQIPDQDRPAGLYSLIVQLSDAIILLPEPAVINTSTFRLRRV